MKNKILLISIIIVVLFSSCKSINVPNSTNTLRTDGIYFYQEPINPYDTINSNFRPFHCFRFYDNGQVIEGHTIPHPKDWTSFDIKYPEHLNVSNFKIKKNQITTTIYYETSIPNYKHEVSADLIFLKI